MVMQFLSEKFSFNGVTSTEMDVCLITLDNDVIRDFGNIYQQGVSIEGNLNNSPFYSNEMGEIEDMTLNLMLVDIKGNPKTWTNKDIQKITYWLISDTFKPFVSEDNQDLVYYVKCTNINKKFSNDMKGYLECTFKFFGDSAYTRFEGNIQTNQSGVGVLSFMSPSNVDELYRPIIKVTNLGDIDTVNRIEMNGITLEVKGLLNNEEVIIDNKMCTVFNTSRANRLDKCNRKWLGMNIGENNVTIMGNCKVNILADFKVRV